jgi:hypothetical protein
MEWLGPLSVPERLTKSEGFRPMAPSQKIQGGLSKERERSYTTIRVRMSRTSSPLCIYQ